MAWMNDYISLFHMYIIIYLSPKSNEDSDNHSKRLNPMGIQIITLNDASCLLCATKKIESVIAIVSSDDLKQIVLDPL